MAACVVLLAILELALQPGFTRFAVLIGASSVVLVVCLPVATARCPRCRGWFFTPFGKNWLGYWLPRRACGRCGLRLWDAD
jgi:ribosomal protein S27AE